MWDKLHYHFICVNVHIFSLPLLITNAYAITSLHFFLFHSLMGIYRFFNVQALFIQNSFIITTVITSRKGRFYVWNGKDMKSTTSMWILSYLWKLWTIPVRSLDCNKKLTLQTNGKFGQINVTQKLQRMLIS